MPTRTTAIVPLRALGAGKTRLALRLTPEQRAALARAMFLDVIDALAASAVDEVVVAAGDDDAAAVGRELGLRVEVDPPGTRTLDEALAAAADAIGAVPASLIVTADLPLLRSAEIDAVLASDAAVAIAPTHDGGTGALLRRPGEVIRTAYGPASADRHGRRARDAGLTPDVIDRPGLRRDLDTWADLVALPPAEAGPRTARLLPQLLAAA